VTFRVDTPHRYQMGANWDWSNAGAAIVRLTGPGLDMAEQHTPGFGLDGTLLPGTYTLRASATSADSTYLFDRGGIARFELALSSVPEPGSLLLFGLGALGLCVGRWKRQPG
jgi:hypothetical protein